MKRRLFILIIIAGLIPFSFAFGQSMTFPKWLEGTWNNSYESNTKKFEFWTFWNDSIFLIKGLPPSFDNNKYGDCLNTKYVNYDMLKTVNDSIYKLQFSKINDTTMYEFKLNKVYYSEKPVLTISISHNGSLKRVHSTSCNIVLTK